MIIKVKWKWSNQFLKRLSVRKSKIVLGLYQQDRIGNSHLLKSTNKFLSQYIEICIFYEVKSINKTS